MSIEDLRPGDKMVMTLKAVEHGLVRNLPVTGELVRVIRCQSRDRGLDGRALKVRRDGYKTATDYHPMFWRKLEPGRESEIEAVVTAANEKLKGWGCPPLRPLNRPLSAPLPEPEPPPRKPHPKEKVWPWSPNYQPPQSEPEVSPDTMVWALVPGGKYPGITRRKCRLRDVPDGWEWEAADD